MKNHLVGAVRPQRTAKGKNIKHENRMCPYLINYV